MELCDQETCTVATTITQSGASAPFTISDVPAGQWQLDAWQDFNANGEVDNGDGYGCYEETAQGCGLISAPKSNATIRMRILSGGGGGSGGGSGGGGTGSSISGTVMAAPGADIAGTIVAACTDTSNCPFSTLIQQSGSSADYTLPDVPAGQYAVIAWLDTNGNNTVDPGEDFGCAGATEGNCAFVTAPASGVDIQLQHAASGGSTISGTISAVPDGDTAGIAVFACNDNDCPFSTMIEQSGASAAFSITGVTDGQYTVEAIQDLNGNGEFDAGDAYGCFEESGDTCGLVEPPAAGIDFAMHPLSAGGGTGGGTGGVTGGGTGGTGGSLAIRPGMTFVRPESFRDAAIPAQPR
ncbi:MAG TPA: hypothetical protein VF171_03430 [Trueperaceae bacterium]